MPTPSEGGVVELTCRVGRRLRRPERAHILRSCALFLGEQSAQSGTPYMPYMPGITGITLSHHQ